MLDAAWTFSGLTLLDCSLGLPVGVGMLSATTWQGATLWHGQKKTSQDYTLLAIAGQSICDESICVEGTTCRPSADGTTYNCVCDPNARLPSDLCRRKRCSSAMVCGWLSGLAVCVAKSWWYDRCMYHMSVGARTARTAMSCPLPAPWRLRSPSHPLSYLLLPILSLALRYFFPV